ncbi:MAG: TIGR03936 family radical SAM-associated protein [Lachnospiraceae bacterium]|nr:TIGR03936 family radical SAM-associated protein [Lachnospiraceae bacterium]
MKVRVKFTKNGPVKFIGHLDTLRYFQKAIRRAEIPVAYSEGYSPHMIMSFAAPLGVGITSDGEYFDMELTEEESSRELVRRLNAQMADGVTICSIRRIPEEKAANAMALVAAADYLVSFRQGKELPEGWQERITDFLSQDSIVIMKKTKKSEKEIDILPWIFDMHLEGESIFLKLSSGSVHNLKPELVLDAFAAYLNTQLQPFSLLVHRMEVYANQGEETAPSLITLENLGEDIE